RTVLKTKLNYLSDRDLANLFLEHESLIRQNLGWGMISTFTEMPHSKFFSYLENFLQKKLANINLSRSAAEYLNILSSIKEKSFQQKQRLDLLRLSKIKSKSMLQKEINKNVEN